MGLLISCEKESEIALHQEAIVTDDENLTKEIPPYFEVETWEFYPHGTFNCVPPATNCTIAIVRPKADDSIIEFIESNKEGDFFSNADAVNQNSEMLSDYIEDDILLKRIAKGDLFVKFMADENAGYFIALNEMENDFTSSNVFSVWKFKK
ncbi:MAG: hypothetical protein ACOCXO_00125 [Bacteroidota bacterium]